MRALPVADEASNKEQPQHSGYRALQRATNTLMLQWEVLRGFFIYAIKSQVNNFEVWLSLVERCVRDAEAASSSLVTSTITRVHNGFELWTREFLLHTF